MKYKTLNTYYRETFGCKVYKLAIDSGLTCPNRDGSLGTRGCIFCSASGGGEFAESACGSVREQLERAKSRVRAKAGKGKYIAYFQSFSNTYGPVDYLRKIYWEAMEAEDIVGLSIGTRPDCIPEPVLALLREANQIKPVSVELGLQTIHEDTARYIRRGYPNSVYFDTVSRLKEAGLNVVTHVILGLPGETREMAMETTRQVVAAGTDGVKFHLLHVLRGTDLEQEYMDGKFQCLELDEYGEMLKKCLAVLPEHVVVHRITGDGAKRDLIAPLWSANKKYVLNYLNRCLADSEENGE